MKRSRRFAVPLAAALAALGAAGARAETPGECAQMRRAGRLAEAKVCYGRLLASGDPWLRAEGYWGLRRRREANDQFRLAVERQPKNADLRVRWGRLYLDNTQVDDAAALFGEALEIQKDHPGALLGAALAAAWHFDQKAVDFARAALKSDPQLLEAQELLARLALEESETERAIDEADKALQMSGRALDAMAVRATIDWLADKSSTPWIERILKINPVYGEAYGLAGRIFVLNRRYEEAIALFRKALDLNPELWDVRAELGVNLMRLGEEREAREHLERCYAADFRSAATVNSLRLIDSYKNFRTIQSDVAVLKLHSKEADLLKLYFEPELNKAVRAFEKRYQVKLDRPVQLEVYPDHEDFAVRTMGLPGLGALGVTFGHVVAMDSPSGRKPGSFHWASTLWHELSHVFVLAATRRRVPRWFTEGVAVHEETATSPDWGDRLRPEILAAIRGKKLLPVAHLDRGFVRPAYPSQVIVSYFQAGRICDYIVEKHGFGRLLEMMRSFAGQKSTPEVIELHLGLKAEEFDKQFLSWLEAQTAATAAGFDNWKKGAQALAKKLLAKDYDAVIAEGPGVRDLYPDYVEESSVYEMLAEAYLAKDRKAEAMAELERYARRGGRDPSRLKRLAKLQAEAGKKKEAARTLAAVNYIYPVADEELHRTLGGLLAELGDLGGAVREYEAAVASQPVDPAGAHYNLARAYHAARRVDDAREQVLLALEAAPGYRPAQKLLLEIEGNK